MTNQQNAELGITIGLYSFYNTIYNTVASEIGFRPTHS
jgi:hypothetical protein